MTADTNVPDVNDFNAFKREIDRIDMRPAAKIPSGLENRRKKRSLPKR